MKVAIIFVLFFATVLCRPARKFFSSSSESSEEAVRPARPARYNMKADVLDSAIEIIQAALDSAPADSPDEASDPDTASVDPAARTDSDDTDEDETEESDEDKEEDDTSDSDESAESAESSSMAPSTSSPVTVEPTQEPLPPTVGIDEGRGDSLGGGYYYGGGENPSDYKKTGIYHDDYSVHKVPSPYKSYETLGMAKGKKTAAYGGADGNEVEKTPKVYKVQALQVHTDFLEEDTSTPEVDTQGLDTSFGTSLDQEHRQASFPGEEEQVPDEEEGEGEEEGEEDESSSPSEATESASESASASMEGDEEESQSSEETKDTPGAADSDSDESEEGDSAESEEANEGAVVDPEVVSDVPVVIAAK